MSAAAVLDELKARGIRIKPRPNGNLYLVPKSRLTPDLLERVRANKPDLYAYLRAGELALWCESNRIDPTVGAELLQIEDEALGLGWPHDRLWNPDFWPHTVAHPRGLASVMSPGDTITEVTATCITILALGRHVQRFSRVDS